MNGKSFCKLFTLQEGNVRSDKDGLSKAKSQNTSDKLNNEKLVEPGKRSQEITKHIEDIVLNTLMHLKNGQPPVLSFFNRRIWKNVSLENMTMKGSGSTNVLIDFGQPQCRSHMALIFCLLSNVHHYSITGASTTKRELFYKCLGTLKSLGYPNSQGIVDSAMSDIGALVNLPPRLIGVLPSSRGLVAGKLCLSLVDKNESSNSSIVFDTEAFANECCPIPGDIASLSHGEAVVKSPAQLVLIVEKDATFQKLLDDGVLELLNPCILITGKGYPDVSTRRLLHIIWKSLNVPILALVDADPHGIEIMLTYRFGSLAMSKDADELAVPGVRWLGVHPTDILNLGLPAQSLLPLGPQGTAKAEALLTRPYIQAHPLIFKEVETMIKCQCKAEMEVLLSLSSTYITDVYIPGKISLKKAI